MYSATVRIEGQDRVVYAESVPSNLDVLAVTLDGREVRFATGILAWAGTADAPAPKGALVARRVK